MRVLYLFGHYPVRSETFVEREISGLRRMGISIDVCPLVPLAPLQTLYAALRHPQCTLNLDILSIRALKAIPAARKAGHIHAHFLGFPARAAALLSARLGIPYSLAGHARDVYVESTPETVIFGAAFRTACTETLRTYLRDRYPNTAFELIRHGLDPATCPRERRAGPLRILAVGRCVEKKGFQYLLEALAQSPCKSFDWTCTVAGDGPLLPELRAQARRLNLIPRIAFTGALPPRAVAALYRRADVLVAPSVVAADGDRDGLPNVILEAMAHGVPVVATDAGAIPEAVTHEATGLLAPQRDAPALAAAIRRACTDATLRQRLTQAAFERLKQDFNPAHWLERLYRLYILSAR